MSLISSITSDVLNGPTNRIREAWDMLKRVPGGRIAFSKLMSRIVPYTGSIAPMVIELQRGRARVRMEDRYRFRNHLNSLHAVALVNLAEFTGNLALVYSLPDSARFIVKGLSIDYLKKARGPILAECVIPESATNAIASTKERSEHKIVVRLTDQSGDEVARAELQSLVGPKR